MIRVSLSDPRRNEGTFSRGDLFPAFKKAREHQHSLFALTAFQVTLIQRNQYAIVGYFGGAACPKPQNGQEN